LSDWERIVDKHGPLVWQTAYRLLGNHNDAGDCFQETFVAVWQISKRQRIRSYPAILAKVATSRAIDIIRKNSRGPIGSAEHPDMEVLASGENTPLDEVRAGELIERLRRAIGQLPAYEAEVFCLRFLNGLSYRQISRQLGIKTNTTGVLLHRARRKLRLLLQSQTRQQRGETE